MFHLVCCAKSMHGQTEFVPFERSLPTVATEFGFTFSWSVFAPNELGDSTFEEPQSQQILLRLPGKIH